MERTPQCADARGGASEEIRLARGNHADRRGRTILLMIGMQHEDEVQRLHDLGLQIVITVRQREHHVQEVRCVVVFRLGINDRQSARLPISERRDRAHLGNQPRDLYLETVRVVGREQVGTETAGGVDHRGQNCHRVSRGGEALEMILHAFVQQLVFGEPLGKLPELVAVRQAAPDQQERDLDERRLLREFFDWDSAIPQDALFAVDEGDGAFAGTGIAVAVVEGDMAGLASQTSPPARSLSLVAACSTPFRESTAVKSLNHVMQTNPLLENPHP
jgi:hypothetical protein